MKHSEAEIFDTNFVKHYFQDPDVLKDSQKDEKIALLASLDQIWEHVKDEEKNDFSSELIK